MKTSRFKIAVVGVLLGAAAVTTFVGVPALQRRLDAAEYPPSPFAPFPAEWPAMLIDSEAPREGEANKRWWADRKKAQAFYREHGAIARATDAERQALQLSADQKYVEAWEKAADILRENPESIPAMYVLAVAEQSGQSNFPRALRVTRKARHLCEQRGALDANDADAREWYIRLLDLEEDVLRSLERFEEALRATERLEQAYRPSPESKIWPLIKLRRLDEAEALVAQLETTGRWTFKCMNDRIILANLARKRAAGYRLGLEVAKQSGDESVMWSNLAQAALESFQRDEAEKHLLKAANMKRINYAGTPWMDLGDMYVDSGRFAEALEARRKAIAQRAKREPHRLAFDQGRFDASLAKLFLSTGHTAEGEAMARRSRDCPDRLASNTLEPAARRLSEKLLLTVAVFARREQAREAGNVSPFALAAMDTECWTMARQLSVEIARDGRPNDMRPFVPDGAELTPWLMGTLLQVLPPGAALELVRQARAEEQAGSARPGEEEIYARAEPYFDAFEAEAFYHAGRNEEALDAARRALDKLPSPGERLLRGRTAAIAGEAARRLGRADEALALALQAWNDFPAVFRLLGLAIPVALESDDSTEAKALARQLTQSPRVRVCNGGVPMSIAKTGDTVRLTVKRNGRDDFESVALGDETALLAQAHHLLLSSHRLSVIEINALDAGGDASGGTGVLDERLKPTKKKQ